MNENKNNLNLITQWYESYYYWNSALNINNALGLNALNCAQNSSRLFSTTRIHNDYRSAGNSASLGTNHHHHHNQNQPQQPQPQRIIIRTELPIYKVPSLFRRFLAELFDAVYVQIIKVIIALLLLNYTNLISEDSFKIVEFFEDIINEENLSNIRLPTELLFLEFGYVFISVLFESFCLYKRGYTPGKYLLNLKVVSCHQINDLLMPGHIHVIPGVKLGLKAILLRTCLKNFSIVFLFPTIVFFLLPAMVDYGQTSYDKASESIVVQNVN